MARGLPSFIGYPTASNREKSNMSITRRLSLLEARLKIEAEARAKAQKALEEIALAIAGEGNAEEKLAQVLRIAQAYEE